MVKKMTTGWTKAEVAKLKTLNTPFRIQTFLDKTEYNGTKETRSPRYVISLNRSHCMEGALFAAACLENIGYPPLVLDLQAFNDDDHVIAIYKVKGFWGAVAKSNFTTLRYREPVYRSLRELAMSYFDFYFNLNGEKSVRGFSLPQNLKKFDSILWRTTEDDLEEIGYYLDKVKHFPLVNKEQIRNLENASDSLMKSSLLGSNPDGLYKPK
jgi:hypothetical protein